MRKIYDKWYQQWYLLCNATSLMAYTWVRSMILHFNGIHAYYEQNLSKFVNKKFIRKEIANGFAVFFCNEKRVEANTCLYKCFARWFVAYLSSVTPCIKLCVQNQEKTFFCNNLKIYKLRSLTIYANSALRGQFQAQ